MIKAVFFDVNETLLSLSLLKESFDKQFDDANVLRYWFTKLLHISTVMGAMNEYKNFGDLAGVVLENIFHENSKQLAEDTKAEILSAFRNLPAYDDVPKALKLLRENKIRTIAVSNSSMEMIREQLTNAGIIDLFDAWYSVDSVAKYKPFKDIYHHVADAENISVGNIVMVATHDWDLFGAKKAGLTTAYIERKREIYNPYYLQPDMSKTSLVELVQEIINNKQTTHEI